MQKSHLIWNGIFSSQIFSSDHYLCVESGLMIGGNTLALFFYRRSSGLESKSSKLHMDSELLTKDGHAMPLPLDFANQLFTFRHFDKVST